MTLDELRTEAQRTDEAYKSEYKRRMDLGEKELYKVTDGELGRLRKEAEKAVGAYRKAKDAARHQEFYGKQEGETH